MGKKDVKAQKVVKKVETDSDDSDSSVEVVAKKVVVSKTNKKVETKKVVKKESSSEESSEEEVKPVKKAPVKAAKKVVKKESSSEEESSEEEVKPVKKAPVKAAKKVVKKESSSEEESSEEEVKPVKKAAKKVVKKESSSEEESSEEEVKPVKKAPVKAAKKKESSDEESSEEETVKPVKKVVSTPTDENQEFEVKIKGMSYNATKDDIEKLCNTFTKVKSVFLMTDRETGQNKGFGFVKLFDAEGLQQCIDNSGIEHMGRSLQMEQSFGKPQQSNIQTNSFNGESASVFVGNLSFNTQTEQLKETFAQCGEIINARVATDRETGQPKGFGFIDFADATAAKAAFAMAGTFIDGRPIRVDSSTPKPKGDFGGGRGGRGGRGGDRGGRGGGRGGRGGRGGAFDEAKNANKGNIVAFEGSKKKL